MIFLMIADGLKFTKFLNPMVNGCSSACLNANSPKLNTQSCALVWKKLFPHKKIASASTLYAPAVKKRSSASAGNSQWTQLSFLPNLFLRASVGVLLQFSCKCPISNTFRLIFARPICANNKMLVKCKSQAFNTTITSACKQPKLMITSRYAQMNRENIIVYTL